MARLRDYLKMSRMLQSKVRDAAAPTLKWVSLLFLVVPPFEASLFVLWIVLWLSENRCMYPDDTLAACSVFYNLEPGLTADLPHYNVERFKIGHVSDNGFVLITAMDMYLQYILLYLLPRTSLCIHEAANLSKSEFTGVFLSFVMYCPSSARSLCLPSKII